MRVVGVLRSSDKTQRGERADGEYSYPKPERPRRRGVPVRLDGRDDGLNARLRQSEPAVPPVFRAEVHEAPTVGLLEAVGVDRLIASTHVAEDRAPGAEPP